MSSWKVYVLICHGLLINIITIVFVFSDIVDTMTNKLVVTGWVLCYWIPILFIRIGITKFIPPLILILTAAFGWFLFAGYSFAGREVIGIIIIAITLISTTLVLACVLLWDSS